MAKCGSPQPKNMSPTEGPHQSIRPRSPGALLGPTAAAAPTALGESGEQRELDQARALVLIVEGQSPSPCRPAVDTVPTRGRHKSRPPIGTPRYGEVFLKAAWRGVRPTPLKNPQEQRTTWPHTFESPWTFKRGSPKIRQALPRPLQEDAGGLPKIWRALPRPLAGTAPKGSYFAHRSGLAALGPLW